MRWSWKLPLLAIASAGVSFGQAPDPVALMRAALRNHEAREAQAKDFEYVERVSYGNLRKAPQVTYEHILVDGQQYRRELPNGKLMTAEEEERARDDDAWNRVALAQAHAMMSLASIVPDDLPRLSFQYFLSFFDVRQRREEILDGRKTYVLDATPKKGQRPSISIESDARTFKMKIWIDEADCQIMRVKAVAIHSGVIAYPVYVKAYLPDYPDRYKSEKTLYDTPETYAPGTTIVVDWRKIDGEVWLPLDVHIKGIRYRPYLQTGRDLSQITDFQASGEWFEQDTVFYGYRKSNATAPAHADAR